MSYVKMYKLMWPSYSPAGRIMGLARPSGYLVCDIFNVDLLSAHLPLLAVVTKSMRLVVSGLRPDYLQLAVTVRQF